MQNVVSDYFKARRNLFEYFGYDDHNGEDDIPIRNEVHCNWLPIRNLSGQGYIMYSDGPFVDSVRKHEYAFFNLAGKRQTTNQLYYGDQYVMVLTIKDERHCLMIFDNANRVKVVDTKPAIYDTDSDVLNFGVIINPNEIQSSTRNAIRFVESQGYIILQSVV